MTSCSCPTLHILCINHLPLSLTTLSQLPRQLPWSCGLSCSCDTLPEDYKLVNIPARRTSVVLLCCEVNRLTVSLSSSQIRKTVSVSSTSLGRVSFLRGFSLFFKKSKVLLWFALSHEVQDFAVSGTPVPKKSFHYLGPSPMRPNELWTCPGTEPPGLAPGCQRR